MFIAQGHSTCFHLQASEHRFSPWHHQVKDSQVEEGDEKDPPVTAENTGLLEVGRGQGPGIWTGQKAEFSGEIHGLSCRKPECQCPALPV